MSPFDLRRFKAILSLPWAIFFLFINDFFFSSTTTASSTRSSTAPTATSSRVWPKKLADVPEKIRSTGCSAVAWAWAGRWWRCIQPSSTLAPERRSVSHPAGPTPSRRSEPLTKLSTISDNRDAEGGEPDEETEISSNCAGKVDKRKKMQRQKRDGDDMDAEARPELLFLLVEQRRRLPTSGSKEFHEVEEV